LLLLLLHELELLHHSVFRHERVYQIGFIRDRRQAVFPGFIFELI